MWVFSFDAPRGCRVMSGFSEVTVMEPAGYWWVRDDKKWVDDIDKGRGKHLSSHHDAFEGAPRTFRAFKRYLKRRPELRGCEVLLCHGMFDTRGFNLGITAKWVDE